MSSPDTRLVDAHLIVMPRGAQTGVNALLELRTGVEVNQIHCGLCSICLGVMGIARASRTPIDEAKCTSWIGQGNRPPAYILPKTETPNKDTVVLSQPPATDTPCGAYAAIKVALA